MRIIISNYKPEESEEEKNEESKINNTLDLMELVN